MLRSFNPSTLEEATIIARGLIQQGHWVGLGLTQLASRHLPKLGLSIEQALDPCTNLREGGRVLVNFYIDAMKKYQNPQDALYAAISAYNTGNFGAGFSNGYVQKVVNAAGYTVPALQAGKPQRAKALANAASRPQGMRVAGTRTSLDARFAKLEAENF
ncbi:hypothetical protein AU476_40845 [Cupriavidus sp. UYMSc13B]|nr:hypothetical protein AU476_40845 [Cupriavidus sp. UYMSc13B]